MLVKYQMSDVEAIGSACSIEFSPAISSPACVQSKFVSLSASISISIFILFASCT